MLHPPTPGGPCASYDQRRCGPGRALLLVVAALALVAGACGGGGERTATTEVDQAGLPTLPPIEERAPELFDGRGCLVIEPGSTECSTRAEEIDAAAAGDSTDAVRSLSGFTGRYYAESPTAGAVVVLDETVAVASSGPWSARGLVRNERDVALSGLVLHASLRSADGVELGTASSPLPVSPLRPGEPAPFVLGSDVAAEQVASVAWSVTQDLDGANVGSRQVEVVTYWERGFADPRFVDMYLHRDQPPAHPYLLFGGVTNHGAEALEAPRVVAAWLDGQGRVIWVADTAVVPPDAVESTEQATAPAPAPTTSGPTTTGPTTSGPTTSGPPTTEGEEAPVSRVEASAGADFLFVVDEVPGLALDGLEVMLWVVSR